MSIPASVTASAGPGVEAAPGLEARPGGRIWARLRTHPSAIVGRVILAAYVLVTVLGPLLLRSDPFPQNLSDAFLPSSLAHPLGTDDLGRAELVRLIYGTRYTLAL